jgi:hypothetical protein
MRLAVVGLVCGLLLGPALEAGARRCGDDVGGRAVPCDCGDELVGSRTLGDDDPITSRVCSGPGLVVDVPAGSPAATLALGGHEIAGSGRAAGILVLGGGAGGLTLVGPGGVRGFDVGVQATPGALARVAGVRATQNRSDGFSLAGAGYVVTDCEATENGRDGVALRGAGYRLEGNSAHRNGRHGFSIAGREAVIGGAATNEAAGNGHDGFRVLGHGHDVAAAVATANGSREIATLARGKRAARCAAGVSCR